MAQKHWSKGRFYEARPGELLSYMADHYDGQRWTWVDIGAHFGNHALFADAVMGFRRIVCFEPSKVNRSVLYTNINSACTDVVAAGCSDAPASAFLADIDAPDHSGSKHLAPQGEPCRLVTVDGEALQRVSVIKIDAEGHERQVITGAMDTITRCRPWVLVETDDADAIHAMLPDYKAPHRTANASPTYVYRP